MNYKLLIILFLFLLVESLYIYNNSRVIRGKKRSILIIISIFAFGILAKIIYDL